MHQLLDYLFDWLPFGFGVPILVGIGLALLADEFRQFLAARVCFYFAAAYVCGKVLMWSYFTSEKFYIRGTVTFLVLGFLGMGLNEGLRLISRRESHPSDGPAKLEPVPALGIPDPPISSSYEMLGGSFPIAIRKGAKTRILVFREDRTATVQIYFTNDETWYWPKMPKKKLNPRPYFGVLHITNQATVKVFNVITAVNVEFRHPSFVTADPPLASQTARIELDAIAAGEPCDIYVLNQSPYAVIISLPDSGSLEVQGQGSRRKVKFSKKLNSIVDLSQLTVPPSNYKWKGDEVMGFKE
jgi:hypothetical protein